MRIGGITSAQIRAARALLRWSANDLARQSSVGVNTIRRAEVAEKGTRLTAANELAIRRALEAAGVEFIDENGGGPGLRLRKRPRAKPAKGYLANAWRWILLISDKIPGLDINASNALCFDA